MKGKIPDRVARRKFLAGLGASAVATAAASLLGHAHMKPMPLLGPRHSPLGDQQETGQAQVLNSPFRVAIINDEISQDFGHACEVAAREFGTQWIELRGMWNKNILNLDSSEVAEARRILVKYGLRVTISPVHSLKSTGREAPQSKFSQRRDFKADFTFNQQHEVLKRGIELAKTFQTDRVRCFDFRRLDDQKPYRPTINEKLMPTKRVKKASPCCWKMMRASIPPLELRTPPDQLVPVLGVFRRERDREYGAPDRMDHYRARSDNANCRVHIGRDLF